MSEDRQYPSRLERKLEQFLDSQYFRYLKDIPAPDLDSRILIEIPAFCDPELLSTMRSALAMAANQDRIHFAVCYQSDDMAELREVESFPHCRVKYIPVSKAPGLCAARYEASLLHGGEEYVLHVDSHMRFASFWDVCVIDQYSRCPGDKKVLTEYAIHYGEAMAEPVDSEWFDKSVQMYGKKVGFSYFQENTDKARFTGKYSFHGPTPQCGAFIGGHFLFGCPEMDIDVPPDPDTFFTADEACVAMRLWTHGYDIWHPGVRAVYHLYGREESTKKAGLNVKVQRFASSSESSRRSASETPRMAMLFTDGLNPALGRFGLGTERTAEEYYAYAGINYRSRMARLFSMHGSIGIQHDATAMAPACICGKDITGKDHPMRGTNLRGVHSDMFFVIVTAYKAHNELVETVRSLFRNADNPERVRVCVVAQLTDEEWLGKVRELGAEVVPCEPKGAGHAHYVGEEYIPNGAAYVLYSEEHMYYVYGWDTAIAAYMRYCGKKAVISDWAQGFDYDHPFPTLPGNGTVICARGMLPYGHPLIQFGRTFDIDRPVRGAFIIGHNLVVPAEVARTVRHSPDMYLNSNESYMNYRYWCAGVDVYHAPRRYCYHYYAPSRNGSGDGTRGKEHGFSAPRMKHLLGLPGGDPMADMRFALGSERTVKSFAMFSGADPFTGTCSMRAQLGMFADDAGNDVVPLKPLDCRADGARWRGTVSLSSAGAVDIDAVHRMGRKGLEALCGNNGPLVGVWPDGVINSHGGCIIGLPGVKLSVTSGARIILHPDSRLFILGDMVFGNGCIVEVHPGADLVMGPRTMNVNGIIDCWERIDLLDTIVGQNVFISDGYACSVTTADKKPVMLQMPVLLGPHAWIASGVNVLPGTVMRDACVGAMSAVSGYVKPGTVVAGNPAKIIKEDCRWYG